MNLFSIDNSEIVFAYSGNKSSVDCKYRKDGVWVGHLLSGYSLPMEDPSLSKVGINAKEVGGTWRESIKAAFEATRLAFPGGEIIAHLDHK